MLDNMPEGAQVSKGTASEASSRKTPHPIIREGAWALVTGASSGIGWHIAKQLAERGMNIVAVARSQERLEELADSLATQTEIQLADLSKATERNAVIRRLESTKKPPVDLLVNNAGIWQFSSFEEITKKDLRQMLDVNLTALTLLTHAAVSQMLKRDPDGRGHGGIVNISSIAGFLPLPYEATYGATKAFVTSFSQGLYEELKDTGVLVCAVAPGVTRTELHERANGVAHVEGLPEQAWMTAEEVARLTLKAVDKRDPFCVPGAINKVMSAFLDIVPTPIARMTAGRVNKLRSGK